MKPDTPWWKLPAWTWLLLALGAIVSLWTGLFLDLFDTCFRFTLSMTDFRLWPQWYFVAIAVILAYSVYWFSFYVQTQRHGFNKRWKSLLPVILTGTASIVLFLVLTVHRFQCLSDSLSIP